MASQRRERIGRVLDKRPIGCGCFTQVLLYELTNPSIYVNTFVSDARNGSVFKNYP